MVRWFISNSAMLPNGLLTPHSMLRLWPALVSFAIPLEAVGQVSFDLERTLVAHHTEVQSGETLGRAVAMDGNLLVVGAPLADAPYKDNGIVRVYDRSTLRLLYTVAQPAGGALRTDEHFGSAVAVSGNMVVVGSPSYSPPPGASFAGAVYVYDLTSAKPEVPVRMLTQPSPAYHGAFGVSLSLSGGRLAVSSNFSFGEVYLYDLTGAPTEPPFKAQVEYVSTSTSSYSVALSDTRLAVGVRWDDRSGSDTGMVQVFDVSQPPLWTGRYPLLYTILNPAPAAGDNFGSAVSLSGNRLVVAAKNDDAGATDGGTVYVFDVSGTVSAVPVRTLNNPEPAAQDNFGEAVAIWNSRVVISASFDDADGTDAGRAWVYELASASPAQPVKVLRMPGAGAGDRFGAAVAVSGDGVLAGAPDDDSGAINSGSAWLFDVGNDLPPPSAAMLSTVSALPTLGLGTSIAVSGNLLVAGAPENWNIDSAPFGKDGVFVYDLSTLEPHSAGMSLQNPGQLDGDAFGAAVAASGRLIVVGSPGKDIGAAGAGSAFVYDFASAIPLEPVLALENPGPQDFDNFGLSLALEGTTALVAASGKDLGALNAGAVYVYDLAGDMPALPNKILQDPSPHPDAAFGVRVAISRNLAVVAANGGDNGVSNEGKVFVFDLAGVSPLVPVLVLENPSPVANDRFGWAVSISGNIIVVGSPLKDFDATDVGAVYVYDLTGLVPSQPVRVFQNPAPAASDRFGAAVSVSGHLVAVGAPLDNSGAGDAGSGYLFDLDSLNPELPVTSLRITSPTAGDQFGFSVALDGMTLAIGAVSDDRGLRDMGSVYVYGPSPLTRWKEQTLHAPGALNLGDSDGDGLSVILEYALLLSPEISDSAPAGYLVTSPNGQRLGITLPRDPARDDVTIRVEATSSLTGPWSVLAESVRGAPFVGPGYTSGDGPEPGLKTVEISDVVNVSVAARRFLRIKVEH